VVTICKTLKSNINKKSAAYIKKVKGKAIPVTGHEGA
jgi:hypothetical protein